MLFIFLSVNNFLPEILHYSKTDRRVFFLNILDLIGALRRFFFGFSFHNNNENRGKNGIHTIPLFSVISDFVVL